MTEAERKAMEWLDTFLEKPALPEARTLKAMLARPVMPEEPSDELLRCLYGTGNEAMTTVERNSVVLNKRYRALYAHLTAPKTKEVEVWHVHFAGAAMGNPYVELALSRSDADRQANKRCNEGATCVNITGPHQHRVPA